MRGIRVPGVVLVERARRRNLHGRRTLHRHRVARPGPRDATPGIAAVGHRALAGTTGGAGIGSGARESPRASALRAAGISRETERDDAASLVTRSVGMRIRPVVENDDWLVLSDLLSRSDVAPTGMRLARA